ncbi:hypothetical protein GYMLUDRAFT_45673 [Collybiopsis luxurians FD-317 M1]|uniref:F-box domain-containing protein n=1 Tax=Collybiopsis luxurians FD-317 M1 TaxID=944289 RepID=A0A0D0CIJ5_9AGAR|nr:hypothetical protein GYMLUDRAFT_45673 [Collybiopsis luxurians FD-317 M1]
MEKKTAAPDNATSTCHIARTPNEILLEILQLSNTFTAVKDEDFAYEGSTQINRNAVRASHVSSRWRSVALATPILWGRFDVSATLQRFPT